MPYTCTKTLSILLNMENVPLGHRTRKVVYMSESAYTLGVILYFQTPKNPQITYGELYRICDTLHIFYQERSHTDLESLCGRSMLTTILNRQLILMKAHKLTAFGRLYFVPANSTPALLAFQKFLQRLQMCDGARRGTIFTLSLVRTFDQKKYLKNAVSNIKGKY